MRLLTKLAIFLVLTFACMGQVSSTDRFSSTAFYSGGYIPATTGTPSTATVYIDAIVLTNNSASVVTVRIRDRSTNCNSAACPIVPDDLSIAASQMYTVPLYKITATSGITWSASAANAVVGRIVGVK